MRDFITGSWAQFIDPPQDIRKYAPLNDFRGSYTGILTIRKERKRQYPKMGIVGTLNGGKLIEVNGRKRLDVFFNEDNLLNAIRFKGHPQGNGQHKGIIKNPTGVFSIRDDEQVNLFHLPKEKQEYSELIFESNTYFNSYTNQNLTYLDDGTIRDFLDIIK